MEKTTLKTMLQQQIMESQSFIDEIRTKVVQMWNQWEF